MGLFNKTNINEGKAAENIALKYLQSQGLKKITSNYHCRYGEVDIIMQDEETLVFVEVRYRKNSNFGSAIETVSPQKIMKIKKTINHYIMTNNLGFITCRIDVIGLQKNLNAPDINWIRNAAPY